MIYILNDRHLESLQCSKCRKYLSVFPVKNNTNRDVTCGRCSRDDDDGVTSPLYKLIAQKFLFRCINKYEGCRKLLRVDQTEAHERECIGKKFKCPKCTDDVDRSVLELIWHYKLEHPSSYLKVNSFKGKPPTEDTMLYVQDEVVFFVLFRHVSILNVLRLSAATLTGVDARQAFIVSHGSFCKHTKKKSCRPINAPNGEYFEVELASIEPVKVVFNLEVANSAIFYDVSSIICTNKSTALGITSNDNKMCKIKSPLLFKKIYGYQLNEDGTALLNENDEIDLTCSNCKKIIGIPIFTCSAGDCRLCYSCKNWCLFHNGPPGPLSQGLLVELSAHLRFPCKWKCGRYFNSDLMFHERACEQRFKKCPVCLSNIHLTFMESHLLEFHQRYFFEEYDVNAITKFIEKQKKSGLLFFLLNNKWCFLEWFLRSKNSTVHTLKCKFGTLSKSNVELKLIRCNSQGVWRSPSPILSCKDIKVDLNTLTSYIPFMTFAHS